METLAKPGDIRTEFRSVHVNPNGPDFRALAEAQDLLSQPEQEAGEPPIEFIGYDHRTEFVPQIAEALHDVDVIAVEAVAPNAEHRQESQELINKITHSKPFSFESMMALTQLKSSGISEFQQNLYQRLLGSGKEVVLIDVNKDDPDFKIQQEAFQKTNEFSEQMFSSTDYKTTCKTMGEAIDAYAREATIREDKIHEQLKDLLNHQSKAGSKHPKIAVLQGMAHTRSAHLISQEGKSVHRTFLPELKESKSVKAVFTYWEEAIRRKKFKPEQGLSPEFLNRVLLEWYAQPLHEDMTKQMSEMAANYARRELIDRFNDTEISTILEKIAANNSSDKSREQKQKDDAEFVAQSLIAKMDLAQAA